MKWNIQRLMIWLISFVASGCQPDPKPTSGQTTLGPKVKATDVIFLTIDTLRLDALTVYNPKSLSKTPHIDELARDAVVYEQAYSPISVTGPAFATLMTGLDPTNHGVILNYYLGKRPLAKSDTTLAETLQKEGYQTAAFVSAFTLRRSLGLNQGFALYDDQLGNKLRRPGSETRSNAISWLNKQDRELFLWFHTFDTHGSLYGWLSDEAKPIRPAKPAAPTKKQINFAPYQLIGKHSSPQFYQSLYAKAVEHTDQEIGLLVAALKESKRYDNALIVLVADHGETFTERVPWFDHGGHASEEQLHIPLIIKYPKTFDKRGRDKRLVALKDITPTVVDVLGFPEWKFDGLSLISEKHRGWPELFGESSHCIEQVSSLCGPRGVLGKSFSVRDKELSVAMYSKNKQHHFYYYDRNTDIHENQPLTKRVNKDKEQKLQRLQQNRAQHRRTKPSSSLKPDVPW